MLPTMLSLYAPEKVTPACRIVGTLLRSSHLWIRLATYRGRSHHLTIGIFGARARTVRSHRLSRRAVHLRPEWYGHRNHQQPNADFLNQLHDYGTTMVSRGCNLMFCAGFLPLTTSL